MLEKFDGVHQTKKKQFGKYLAVPGDGDRTETATETVTETATGHTQSVISRHVARGRHVSRQGVE